MSDDVFRIAIIAGSVSKSAGDAGEPNMHRHGSALWLCWQHGYERDAKRDTVSRETKNVSRPGRGGSVVGDRGEWPKAQLKKLDVLLEAGMTSGLAGEVLGRSGQAVRSLLSRRNKARAA